MLLKEYKLIKSPQQMLIELKENMRGGTGTVTLQHLLNADEINAKCRLCARMTLPPQSSIGLHQHNNEDEIYIITRGQGQLNDGSTIQVVSAGDTILTGNGEQHSLHNHTDTDLELIAVIILY